MLWVLWDISKELHKQGLKLRTIQMALLEEGILERWP